MAGKTGSDLEELRALLAEVKAVRDDVARKGAELRSAWGVRADGSKATPRVLNRGAKFFELALTPDKSRRARARWRFRFPSARL